MIKVLENIPLKDYTTLNIGGPAKYFVKVKSEDELKEAIEHAKSTENPYLVIAGGSNLLISDDGYEGLIIKFEISGIEQNGDDIIVKAGTKLQDLVDYTIEQGLDGMSTMTGVPGSVGGAIFGSAGAYGDNIRDYLQEITYFDGENVRTITKDKYETGYRDSLFKHNRNFVILEASFSGFLEVNTEELKKEAAEIIEKRKEKYPPNTKCPGSFFKNIPVESLSKDQIKQINDVFVEHSKDPDHLLRFGKVPAGPLLEVVGANGDQLGQIKIRENHGNTFINLGEGTAKDFFALAKKWKDKVQEKFGVELEPEVQLVGFDQTL